jgi:hypothetical protein
MDECFASEDARFVEALRQVEQPKILAALADRWKTDARPWARAQLLAYLDQPLDCPGHQPLVKRLFKAAEARRDDELVAAFLVAFDTLVRRARRSRYRWDRATRTAAEEDYLATPRDVLPREISQSLQHPKTGVRTVVSKGGQRVVAGRLFTHRTRHYLRRRAWRYFRWLGYARPADFPAAVAPALRRYDDEDLAKGENILDSWALLNICFRGSEVLEFTPTHLRLAPGRTLGELRAAPRFAPAWETPAALRVLLGLIAQARAQLVRMWAMDLFRAVSARVNLELAVDEIFPLLDHADERVQVFGGDLFAAHPGLATLPLTTWLRLLSTQNVAALDTVCAAFKRHVTSERLTLAQCVDLACVQPVPVARLGVGLLTARAIAPADHAGLGGLADARCAAVAGELATWALNHVGARAHYDLTLVSRFFDSLAQETRDAAWAWLKPGTAAYDDPVLWCRLTETPFDDLRLQLIDHLALRVKMPALTADQLAPVWCAVLLGVHRGGRQKLKAVRDLAAAVAREPATASKLLPVLAVAVRSVRGPERRAGLAAVMTLLAARPELADAVRTRVPELMFSPTEAAA